MSSTTVRYFINDKKVAEMSTTTPGSGLGALVSVASETGGVGSGRHYLGIARILVWWNDFAAMAGQGSGTEGISGE